MSTVAGDFPLVTVNGKGQHDAILGRALRIADAPIVQRAAKFRCSVLYQLGNDGLECGRLIGKVIVQALNVTVKEVGQLLRTAVVRTETSGGDVDVLLLRGEQEHFLRQIAQIQQRFNLLVGKTAFVHLLSERLCVEVIQSLGNPQHILHKNVA